MLILTVGVGKRQTPFDAPQTVASEATPLLAQASIGQGAASPIALVGSTAAGIVPISLASVPGTVSAANLQGALTDLPGTVGSIANGLPGTLQGIANGLPAPVNGIAGGLLGTVGGVAGPLLGAVEGPVAPVLGAVGGILGPTVGGTVGGLLGQVGGTLQGVTAPVDGLAPQLGLGGLLGGLTGSLNGILATQPVTQASVPGQSFLAQPQAIGSTVGNTVPMSAVSNSPLNIVANLGQGKALAASGNIGDVGNLAGAVANSVSTAAYGGVPNNVQNHAGQAVNFAAQTPAQLAQGTAGQVMQVPQSVQGVQSVQAPLQQAQTAAAAAVQYVKVNDNLVPVQLDAAGRVLGLASGLPTITAASIPGHSMPDLSGLASQLPSQATQGLASAQGVAQPIQQQVSSAMGKLPVGPNAAQTLLPSQLDLADVDPSSSNVVSALDTAEDGVDSAYDPSSDDTADALSLVAGAVNGASGTPYTAASAMISTPVSAASAAASSAYGAPQWDNDDWIQPDQSLLGHYASSSATSMGMSAMAMATAAAEDAMTGVGSAITSAPSVSATAINGAQ